MWCGEHVRTHIYCLYMCQCVLVTSAMRVVVSSAHTHTVKFCLCVAAHSIAKETHHKGAEQHSRTPQPSSFSFVDIVIRETGTLILYSSFCLSYKVCKKRKK
jgi:hypothetical protein